MAVLELILLIIAYSLLVISIFLQIVCYKRNLEPIETIALTASLLLLIVSITAASVWGESGKMGLDSVMIFVSMVLVGLTTPLSTLKERTHNISAVGKKYLWGISGLLLGMIGIGYFMGRLHQLQYVVVAFLCISVVASMILIRVSQPQKDNAHRDKIDRMLAIGFLVIVPLSLLLDFSSLSENSLLNIGFMLPLIFALLAVSKIWDDLERLSLFKTSLEAKEQHLKNYTLTGREKEIAAFLTKGKTYKQISEELYISMPTVKTHASNIYKKCGVKNRSELTALLIS